MRERCAVLYLLCVSLAVFLVHEPGFLIAISILHLIAAIPCGVTAPRLWRLIYSIKWFVLFLIVAQIIFPPRSHFLLDWLLQNDPNLAEAWGLIPIDHAMHAIGEAGKKAAPRPAWQAGALVGIYQALQVYTMALVSVVVRKGIGRTGFVKGLESVFLPHDAATIVDACLDRLEERRATMGETRRRKKNRKTHSTTTENDPAASPVRSIMRGDPSWVLDRLEGAITESNAQPENEDESKTLPDDLSTLSRITVVLMSLRMLKVTPGTGLTPGFQNIIVLPLLCYAADRSPRRWSATLVGGATGVLSTMLGLGRNGLFILPAHVLPGIIIDAGWSWANAKPKPRPNARPKAGSASGEHISRTRCIALGAAAGLGRFTGMLLVLLLLGNPELLAAIPFFSAGHLFFGALSGIVTHSLIQKIRVQEAEKQIVKQPHD